LSASICVERQRTGVSPAPYISTYLARIFGVTLIRALYGDEVGSWH
jgi:hypothetical protein